MKKADRKKERFRNEWKYLISTSEKEVLNLRMKPLMKLDPHAETGGYLIRSLYFDDYWNSAKCFFPIRADTRGGGRLE